MRKKPVVLCLIVLLVGLVSGLFPSPAPAMELMLPQVYSRQVDVSGWWMSEKLDGVRGYWDGERLRSRQGRAFSPPAAFTRDLPPFPLEGELWAGRGGFEQVQSVVMKEPGDERWLTLKFGIFDVPAASGPFRERIALAQRWFADHPSSCAFVIEQKPVADHAALAAELHRIEALGGEGLIVRQPDALYVAGRRPDILKVKSFFDDEARVVAHLPGEGRNRDRLGALLVERTDGVRFKIGTGFSDDERENPPPVGATITYKYYGTYESGLPRFPVFLRLRRELNF
ncbi:MAG: DNA ligase [Deltaproteobacteria bacterium]|nr:DNA ligase [Candidatus Anaeroferrophillacea bacterium]